jgi:hypothetical protein
MLTGHAGVSPAVDGYLFFLTIKNPNYGNYQTRCALTAGALIAPFA